MNGLLADSCTKLSYNNSGGKKSKREVRGVHNHNPLPIPDTKKKMKHCENVTVSSFRFITKTRLFKYIENLTSNFQIKNYDIFHISAKNIYCGYSLEPPRRGGSNEHPQSIFLSRNKQNNVYHCKPQFYYIKVGFKGVGII